MLFLLLFCVYVFFFCVFYVFHFEVHPLTDNHVQCLLGHAARGPALADSLSTRPFYVFVVAFCLILVFFLGLFVYVCLSVFFVCWLLLLFVVCLFVCVLMCFVVCLVVRWPG